MQQSAINYKQIYTDIIKQKFPQKEKACMELLNKQNLSAIEIVELNNKVFGTNLENEKYNQRYRSYNKTTILKILEYQKKHRLNNTQLANHFKLSRNSIAKWKKMFLV